MFNNDVTLKRTYDGDKVVSVTDTDNGSTVRQKSLGGGNAIALTISHETTKPQKGKVSAARHLVRVDLTKVEATTPYTPEAVSCYLVLSVPNRPDITASMVEDNLMSLIWFLAESEETDFGNIATAVRPKLARSLAGES